MQQLRARHWTYALQLAVACLVTWYVSSGLFYRVVDSGTDLIGSMWAVVATVFVLKETLSKSIATGVLRMIATVISAVICSIYFLFLPFNPVGMPVLIALGYLACIAFGRPDVAVTTGITTTVIMVVGRLEPETAKIEPLLRLVDTLIGSAVAIAAAWIAGRLWNREEEAVPRADPARKS